MSIQYGTTSSYNPYGSSYGTTSSYNPYGSSYGTTSSLFGSMSSSYAGTGMDGLFSNVSNLLNYTDSMLTQTSQQISALNSGIYNTNSTDAISQLLGLGTTSSGTSTDASGLSSILSLLGLGTISSGTSTDASGLSSILSLLNSLNTSNSSTT